MIIRLLIMPAWIKGVFKMILMNKKSMIRIVNNKIKLKKNVKTLYLFIEMVITRCSIVYLKQALIR